MSALEFSLAFGTVWIGCLSIVMMTATAHQKGSRTLLEKVFWRRAYRMSVRRRRELARKVRDSGTDFPSAGLRDYLQREDILYLASMPAHLVKMVSPVLASFPAGFALAATMKLERWGVWAPSIFTVVFVCPSIITAAIISLMATQAQRRWTSESVTATGRRAYMALLSDTHATGRLPEKRNPFHSPHIPATRALGDFASALEKYALLRATPDGQPMPEVAAKYAGAASELRKLRSGLELDRVAGRVAALAEVRRMLEALASGRVRDIYAGGEVENGAMAGHRERAGRRRQFVALLLFSLSILAIVAFLSMFGNGAKEITVAVIGASAGLVLGAWVKWLRLPSEQGGGSPSGGSGGGTPNP
ncbi:hypothetical protein [Streptomyces sp. NPDC003077]|uniref:hypothetical protein n=1 Tax=Streptomyces sp. NPDC003077 TaxID=3154443 RepID=UPI0033B276D8